ncbi:50S ribosome-binding GTPase [Actinomadura graeca]|uniref:50S ribosome-binding GTPase n=1 Tax=Actinomadura graeca TaxID=2750812 RepID=A0ABX8R4J6_9ACTN|nr:FtsK/SpoIIIE domain-containing protein [Actinomadura graeca]QXJ25982.1 50S ribosome-binding GTPase [Actinomadura graeca]
MPDFAPVEYVIAATPFAAAAGGVAWQRYAPHSFWYGVGYPLKAAQVYGTWHHVASGCGLTRRRRALRWSAEAFPGMAPVFRHRRRLGRVQIDKAPRLGVIRPTARGLRVPMRLHDGQTPDDVRAALDRLAHAWRVHAVRLHSWKPGRVTLLVTGADPLVDVDLADLSAGLLTVVPAVLETGEPFVMDFRAVPHWLITGATNSGKSTLINALIMGLTTQLASGEALTGEPAEYEGQGVALVGFDLKGGVEFTPYEARMSALATERADCLALLDQLIDIVRARMALCRRHRARNIWHPRISADVRPTPIVVLIDEIAELFLMADKSQKEEVTRAATALLRLAQISRAFGVYLVVCGQRVGSDLGSGVTALRSQLSGRICHRVNDEATAEMTLGDMDRAALAAARQIPANMPGVAVVIGSDGLWHRARSAYRTEEQAEDAAAFYAPLAPEWKTLLAEIDTAGELPELDAFESEFSDATTPI